MHVILMHNKNIDGKRQAGRRRAERRHKFMEEFLEEFYEEWDGRAWLKLGTPLSLSL